MSEAVKYLTIAEYASRAGCTRQTVYARLKTNLAPYVIEQYGKKLIDINALSECKIQSTSQIVSDDMSDGINDEKTEEKPSTNVDSIQKPSIRLVRQSVKSTHTDKSNLQLNLILDELKKIEETSIQYGSILSKLNSGSAIDSLTEVIHGQEGIIDEQGKQISRMQNTIDELMSMLNSERAYSRQLSTDLSNIARGMIVINHELLTSKSQPSDETPKRKRRGLFGLLRKLGLKRRKPQE